MEIIDRYLTQYVKRRMRADIVGPDRATVEAILKDFLKCAEWLETPGEMAVLESAMQKLTERYLDDFPTLELLQTVRAHVSLLRVKLAISAVTNKAFRRRLQRPSR